MIPRCFALVVTAAALVSGCAGQQQAEDTAKLTTSILQSQNKAADAYGKDQAAYINTERQAALDKANVADRFQADTDIAVDGLDVTGKGDATNVFLKHTRVKADAILADPLLSAAADPWTPPKGDDTFAKAVAALKPIASGQSAIDNAYFFLGLAKAAQDAANKPKVPAQ